ncbi:hypothetical protein C2E21_8410 [Chlorella sorokiniana]|uniref:Fe2OG dioxygenase domain-containing protein n=1 Tax=Chlorella sorokiniana TaxID=3076 RepID=A0A2P6TEB3_CHLSO|nr:hypothetical protein C2E21_8410 [Chlorella sorokiniana]|eukprot:PRW20980.1 hypothetical protein C2E21_8410 [Chlorella sorokiniana]
MPRQQARFQGRPAPALAAALGAALAAAALLAAAPPAAAQLHPLSFYFWNIFSKAPFPGFLCRYLEQNPEVQGAEPALQPVFDHPYGIIGGKPAPQGRYRYMVSLRVPASLGGEHFCGGTLIVATVLHPEFTYGRNFTNDVALLRLSRPVPFPTFKLETGTANSLAPGFNATILGWGLVTVQLAQALQQSKAAPGLEVAGVGAVRLPLDAAGAAALKPPSGPAAMAPFGRGEETVTNESVRHTWQLEPAQFTLSGEAEVEAQLHKLLIYEPGSFFKPHRDSEKADGMFATLSILLPSVYEGGELQIRHNQWQAELDLAEESAQGACFTAFYADCEHEVLPLRSGHRVVLTYNLVWAGEDPPPAPPVLEEAVNRVIELAQEWEEEELPPDRMCFLFEHRYTEASLRQHGIAALKGRDREAAQMLVAVCEGGAELDASLALVDFMLVEEGEELLYMPPEEAAVGRWLNVRASKFCALVGPSPAFSSLPMDLGTELLASPGQLNFPSVQADQQKEVFTGNEANERVRWYFRAGLVFWPASKRLATTVRADPARQALRLHSMLVSTAGAPAPLAEQATAAAVKLRKHYPEEQVASRTGAAAEDTAAGGQQAQGGSGSGGGGGGEGGGSGGSGGGVNADSDEEVWYDEEAPAELAAELLDHLTTARQPIPDGEQDHIKKILLSAACQLRYSELAEALVTGIRGSSQLLSSAALVWASFGWLPSWLPHWEAQLKSSNNYLSGNVAHVLQGCVDAAVNHTAPDAVAASKAALTKLALALAHTLTTTADKRSGTYQMIGTLLLPMLRALSWAQTPGAKLALEAATAVLLRQLQESQRKNAYQYSRLASECEAIAEGIGLLALADSPTFLGVAATCMAETAAVLGPLPAEPSGWAKPDVAVMCKSEPLCDHCRAIKAFLLDPEAQECTLTQPADPLIYQPKTHLSSWARRVHYDKDVSVTRQRPEESPAPPGTTESFHLTKGHGSHAAAVRQWEEKAEARSKLAALWTEVLLLRLGGQAGGGQRGG